MNNSRYIILSVIKLQQFQAEETLLALFFFFLDFYYLKYTKNSAALKNSKGNTFKYAIKSNFINGFNVALKN